MSVFVYHYYSSLVLQTESPFYEVFNLSFQLSWHTIDKYKQTLSYIYNQMSLY